MDTIGTDTGDVRARGSLAFDVALGVGLALFGILGSYFASQQGQPLRQPFEVGGALLVSAAALALIWRRRWPVAVLGVVFAATLVYFVIGYHDGPIWFPLIIAYFTAAVRGYSSRRDRHRDRRVPGVPVARLPAPRRTRSVTDLVGRARRVAPRAVRRGEIVRIRRERIDEAARMREEETLRRRARSACGSRGSSTTRSAITSR